MPNKPVESKIESAAEGYLLSEGAPNLQFLDTTSWDGDKYGGAIYQNLIANLDSGEVKPASWDRAATLLLRAWDSQEALEAIQTMHWTKIALRELSATPRGGSSELLLMKRELLKAISLQAASREQVQPIINAISDAHQLGASPPPDPSDMPFLREGLAAMIERSRLSSSVKKSASKKTSFSI